MESTSQRDRWTLSPDAVKLVLILGVFNFVVLLLVSANRALDFTSFYVAGRLILEGQRKSLFDLAVQADLQRRLLGIASPLPINHLAFEAVPFIPLALLPFQAALWIWRFVSLGMLIGAVRILANIYKAAWLQILLLALAFFPIALTVVQGQDSILSLFLVTASIWMMRKDRDWLAGLILAFALYKPQFALPIAVLFSWKRGVRFLSGFLVGTTFVVLASSAITGWKAWLQLWKLWRLGVSGSSAAIGIFARAMPNLRGIVAAMGAGSWPELTIVGLLSCILFGLVAWRLRSSFDPIEALAPPVIAFTLLISFHLNLHDLCLLLIPVLSLLTQKSRRAYLCVAACFMLPLFIMSTFTAWFALVLFAVLYLTLPQAQRTAVVTAP